MLEKHFQEQGEFFCCCWLQRKILECHNAVTQGNLRKLMEVLDRKSLVGLKDRSGLTLLHKAMVLGHVSSTRYIIQRFPEALNIPDHVSLTHTHTCLKNLGNVPSDWKTMKVAPCSSQNRCIISIIILNTCCINVSFSGHV